VGRKGPRPVMPMLRLALLEQNMSRMGFDPLTGGRVALDRGRGEGGHVDRGLAALHQYQL
jgi:hypothetical protein